LPSPPANPAAPRIGRYRLLNLLGQGGNARVCRALREGPEGFEKEVAIKVIDRDALEPGRVQSLIDEARLGGLLRHPHVVAIDELDQFEGQFYIAMEYVPGWTLDKLLDLHRKRGHRLPLPMVVRMLIPVCQALQYAHTLAARDGTPLHIVHRDLKPGNLILSRDGVIKIMDFGIAHATINRYRTKEGAVRGTPLYMSPEQLLDQSVDARSDIFSMGAILHELVTGEPWFRGENLAALMRAVIEGDIASARQRLRSVAPAMEPLLMKCMAKEPERRYPDAGSLERDLRSVSAAFPTAVSVAEWISLLERELPVIPTGEFGLPGSGEMLDSGPHPTRTPTRMDVASWLGSAPPSAPPMPPGAAPAPPPPPPPSGLGRDEIPAFLADFAESTPLPRLDRTGQAPPPRQLVGALERAGGPLGRPFEPGFRGDEPEPEPPPHEAPSGQVAGRPLRALARREKLQKAGMAAVFGIGALLLLHTLDSDFSRAVSDASTATADAARRLAARVRGVEILERDASEPLPPRPRSARVGAVEFALLETTVADFETWCGARWKRRCADWPGRQLGQGPEHPAVSVTWDLARQYCEALGMRLPSEAEWDAAARGSGKALRKYPWGAEWRPKSANYCDLGCPEAPMLTTFEDDTFASTAPVGSFPAGASPQGVRDLVGNAAEWSADCAEAAALPGAPRSRARSDAERGPAAVPAGAPCARRVLRGGSWRDLQPKLDASWRDTEPPDTLSPRIGFRCVSGPPL
jgi:serine/threonine-protein kinase